MTRFVAWYSEAHLHSAIGYVTPAQRHRGEDVAILAQRAQVFVAARNANPARWTAPPKSRSHVQHVWLNQPHTVLSRTITHDAEKGSVTLTKPATIFLINSTAKVSA